MQRILKCPLTVKDYVSNPDILISDKALQCPFCPDGHRLIRHGYYSRQALFLGDPSCRQIKVVRLLCIYRGSTVSLLPDFCMPRRQHGPAIICLFLIYLFIEGLSLHCALGRIRPDTCCHSTGQSLRDGFLRKGEQIDAYLDSIEAYRTENEISPHTRHSHPRASHRLSVLISGSSSPQEAFTNHCREFHNRFNCGLI